jgi:CheY-like chemotaxis protein
MAILILDDDDNRHAGFRKILKDCELVHVFTAPQAISALSQRKFDMVCLDHDLDIFCEKLCETPGCGMDVVEFICHKLPKEFLPGKILIHSWNTPAAATMASLLRDLTDIPVIVKEFKAPID